ncbi:hypothetical protein FB45DRAFT_870793 [Roridomyces roridus]|uniref:C2H2-type domain-containing protein n=1 Tax=Roridomyces roridus TaxID=1738132 RepID=A0AAD7FFD5_9AGAR|nr:hypothetical protein FB45DRAFT_870793 [Roridomyces roridus]
MHLSLSLDDLLASQLDIGVGQVDGRLSCKLKPNVHSTTYADLSKSGISLNLESVCGENGMYTLTLYATHDGPSRVLPPPSVASTPSGAAMFAPLPPCTPAHEYTQMPDIDAQSFLLAADASPPSEYYPSPLAFSTNEINGSEFDLASMYMSGDEHLSQMMYMPPQDLSYPSGYPASSASSVAGPSRIPSPHPSFSNSPAPQYPSPAGSPPPTTTTFITTAPPTPPPSDSDSFTNEDSIMRISPGASHRPGRRAQYPCEHPQCDRVLTSPYTRQVHMRTHRAKVRKAFICTLGCGEAFTRQHDRQRHEVSLHGKKCKDVCQRCKRFFSSTKMLDRHVCRGDRHGEIQWPLGDDEVQSTLGTPVAPLMQ